MSHQRSGHDVTAGGLTHVTVKHTQAEHAQACRYAAAKTGIQVTAWPYPDTYAANGTLCMVSCVPYGRLSVGGGPLARCQMHSQLSSVLWCGTQYRVVVTYDDRPCYHTHTAPHSATARPVCGHVCLPYTLVRTGDGCARHSACTLHAKRASPGVCVCVCRMWASTHL